MPVRATSDEGGSSEMLQLESAVLSNTKGQAYYSVLQNWLLDQQTDHATPQRCSAEMMKKVITALQKELQCKHFQEARVLVSAIQHVAAFQNFPDGLPVCLSCGLVEILVYAFQVTQTHISRCNQNPKQGSNADLLMETLLETVNDISDYSAEGKQLTVMKLADKLMDLIVDDRKNFRLRMEAQRTLNLLLENCPGNLTQALTAKDVVKKLMQKMAEMLSSFGDFEMQVACTEALARLVTKSKRPQSAAEWFPNDKFASAFLAIQDLNFETDCRKFLNFVNRSCGSKRSVHSFPCQEAFLGNFKLLQPPDENLPEFWVDFNSASQSITMYVAEGTGDEEDEAGMWETVTIRSDLVKSYSLTQQANSHKLQLNLTLPGKDILHFCPSQQKVATILFASSIDVSSALVSVIGQEKFQLPQSQKKASVSKVNVRVNRGDFSTVGLINGHTVTADVHQPDLNNMKPNPASQRSDTPNRRKVSVPIVPIRIPTLTSYRSSPSVTSSSRNGCTSSGSKSSAHFHQPKTPTRPSSSGTKKVKTPLQIRVADKQPVVSTADDHNVPKQPKPPRKVSRSSTSAAISINTTGTKEKVDDVAGAQMSKKDVNKADSGQETKKTATTKSKMSRGSTKQNGNKHSNIPDTIKPEENINMLGKDQPDLPDEVNLICLMSQTSKATPVKRGKTKTAKQTQDSQNSESKHSNIPDTIQPEANVNQPGKGQLDLSDEENSSQTTKATKGKRGKTKTAKKTQESQNSESKHSNIPATIQPEENINRLGNGQHDLSNEENSNQTLKATEGKRGSTKTAKKTQESQNSESKKTGGNATKTAKKTQESQNNESRKSVGSATRTRKFKLYSSNNEMLLPDSQESVKRRSQRIKEGNSQEEKEEEITTEKETTTSSVKDSQEEQEQQDKPKTKKRNKNQEKKTTPDSSQEDLVIPSSVPGTQNEDNLPACFACISENVIDLAQRRMDQNRSMNSSVCRSPSLSTITEESTQSRKTNSTAGKTPDLQHKVIESTSMETAIKTKFNKTKTQEAHAKKSTYDATSPPQNQAAEIEPKRVLKESNKQAKAVNRTSDKRCRNNSQEWDTVPESQLSQEAPFEETNVEVTKKQETPMKPKKSTGKQSTQLQKGRGPKTTSREKGDPYQFTDTESIASLKCKPNKNRKDPYDFTDTDSVLSHGGKQTKGKKDAASKVTTGKPKTRGTCSQLSTQAFSPELGQENSYHSQNDFHSPIEPSASKKSKQGTTRGRGKKNTEMNKKSKSGSRKKKNKKEDQVSEDDLSDVEIMRDATCSISSVKDKFGAALSDDEDAYQGEEIYKMSGDIATKLNQKKEELEKCYGKTSHRKSTCDKEKSTLEERPADKSATDADNLHSEEEDKDKRRAKKNFKTSNQKKQPAVKDLTRKLPFDPTFMKFPTRTGPIPTPEGLEEKLKKMKKQSKDGQSQKKSFQWEEDEIVEEECRKESEKDQVKTKQMSKENIKPSPCALDEEGLSDIDDIGHFDNSSEDEGIIHHISKEDTPKSAQQSKATNKTKRKQKKKNKDDDHSESEVEDVDNDSDDEGITHQVNNKNKSKVAQQSKTTNKTERKQKKKNKDDDYTESEVEDVDNDSEDEGITHQVNNKNSSKSAQKNKATNKTERKQIKKKNKNVDHTDSEEEDVDNASEDEGITHQVNNKKTSKFAQKSKATNKTERKHNKKSTNVDHTDSEEEDVDNDDEEIIHQINNKNKSKSALQSKAMKKTKMTQKKRNRNKGYTESEDEDISDHEEISDEDDVIVKPTCKSQTAKRSQNRKKCDPVKDLGDSDEHDWEKILKDISDNDEYDWEEILKDSENDVSEDDKVKTQMKTKKCNKNQQSTSQNSSSRSSYSTKIAQRLMEELDPDLNEKKTNKTPQVQPSSSRRSSYSTQIAQRLMEKLDPDSDYEVKEKKTTKTKQQLPAGKTSKEVKRKRADEEDKQGDTDDSVKPQAKKSKVGQSRQQPAKKSRRDESIEHSDVSDDNYLEGDLQSDEDLPAHSRVKKQRRSSNEKPKQDTPTTQTDKSIKNKKTEERKTQKNDSRMFGSQIMDAESDEAVEEQAGAGEDDDQEFDRETVTSVESFHSLCKKLLKHSGGGVAAERSRRHLPKINYKDADESEPSLSGESSVSSAPSISRNDCPGSKNRKTKMPISTTDDRSPDMSQIHHDDDAQSTTSNRSWLIEKPKQKVSTYSKTRAEQWIGIGPLVNLDTVSAKKRPSKSRTGGASKQNVPPVLAKKPKRSQIQSDEEEDNTYIYYYREEEKTTTEVVHKKDKPSKRKKAKTTNKVVVALQEEYPNEEEELDDLEVMRSQQLRHNTTPISSALLEYNTGGDDVDLYPLTPGSVMQDEDFLISQSSIAMTPRRDRTGTPSSTRTPKSVTFEDEENMAVEHEFDEEEVALLSGPVKGPKPSKSALKRKYTDMSDESDDDDDSEEETGSDDVVLGKQQEEFGMLKPKNLFMTNFASALQTKRSSLVLEDADYDEDDNIVVADEAASSDAASSWGSHQYNSDGSMLQMTQMMKVIGQNIKEKIRRKQSNAHQLTESTIKTAQKQVSRLWFGQHKARRKTQEEFQDKLLTEIVGLEADLNDMGNSLQRSQAILQQHQRKVATTLMANVKKVHKLETDYRTEGETLEVELGQHLVRNVKGLLRQGLVDMQKKMVHDVQNHELQTVKRSLQSFIL